METTELIQRAIQDGHLQLITSGKTEKVRYVAVNHAEKWSDPEEKVRAAYYAELIYRYLMGLNRGKGLAQDNFILIADRKARGAELESDIGFNLKSWQQLRFDSTRKLEEALTESIEIFYGLRSV